MIAADEQKLDLARLGSGDSSLRLGVLSAVEAAQCFAAAQREFAYEKMVGTTGKPLPRVQCLQARARPDGTLPVYRYPGNEEGVCYPTHPLSPLTERMCALAQRELCTETLAAAALAEDEPYFNHVVVNYYRGESDFIASHQDKRLDIARNAVIAALSVYPAGEERGVAPRQLELLSADGRKRRQVVEMPQGSLFLLGDTTNQEWQHSVRPLPAVVAAAAAAAAAVEIDAESPEAEPTPPQARISFTLRRCATFRTLEGELLGQGAGFSMAPDGSVRDASMQHTAGGGGGPSSTTRGLQVLYADHFYVAVAKPGGWAVDAAAAGPGAEALVTVLAEQLAGDEPPPAGAESAGRELGLRPVGLVPVEQGASGVVLLARTEAAARALLPGEEAAGAGAGGGCVIETLAVVTGVPASAMLIGRGLTKKKQLNKSARKAVAKKRKKKKAAADAAAAAAAQGQATTALGPEPEPEPKPQAAAVEPARTSLTRECTLWEHEGESRLSLLRCTIAWHLPSSAPAVQSEGAEPAADAAPPPRRHQLRRHLSGASHPVIGDTQYGKGGINRWLREDYGLTRPFLHVARLKLPHPFFRTDPMVPEFIDVRCDDLAQDLRRFLGRIPGGAPGVGVEPELQEIVGGVAASTPATKE